MPPAVVEVHMRPTCGSCRSTSLDDCAAYYYCRVCGAHSYKVIPALDEALGEPVPLGVASPDTPPQGGFMADPITTAAFQHIDAMAVEVMLAGVAQSAEQVPRKDEAVGSTPTSSSRGLNARQQEKVRALVRRRVQLEDARVDRRKAQDDLAVLELTYANTKAATQKRISNAQEKIELYAELTLESESELRKAIIEEVLVSGVQHEVVNPEPDVKEVPVVTGDQEYQLGRDE